MELQLLAGYCGGFAVRYFLTVTGMMLMFF